MTQPATTSTTRIPPSVKIREVGARDGFQNEPELIPTDVKIELIQKLAASGVPRMELTSFVRADVVPQLADGPEVLRRVVLPDSVERSVITPNERGLEAALGMKQHFDDINVFVSASESHNRRNVNRSVAESLEGLNRMLPRIAEAGLRPRASISTAFGCPYEGVVPLEKVVDIARSLIEAGAVDILLGDTTGMANPRQARHYFEVLLSEFGDAAEFTAHFHNTRGAGLANVLGALEAGCTSFDSSFGELGGCPFPPGATGNIATEDLVSMLDGMGVETGIDIDVVLDAARSVRETLGRPLTSHTLVAGPVDWNPHR